MTRNVLIGLGLALLAAGLAWPWLKHVPLGRLPGDILIQREGFMSKILDDPLLS